MEVGFSVRDGGGGVEEHVRLFGGDRPEGPSLPVRQLETGPVRSAEEHPLDRGGRREKT